MFSLRRRPALIGAAIALAALGLLAGQLRRRFIQTWFRDGAPGPAPALAQPAAASEGLAPAARVRVLLVDGLDAATARALPALDGLCRAGVDLDVDVGFPTVSLPVQSVLWTGRTQQQSGWLYRIGPLLMPPPDAVAVRVPASVAVAEDQPFIARSFGFEVETAGDAEGFVRAARERVSGGGRLVFVHVLRVDKAGHRSGAGSEPYRTAAVWADGLLRELLQAAPTDPQTRWFVLSDHGHRPAGGHGGEERAVRVVRGCIAGGSGIGVTRASVHLVDVARAIQDSLGLAPAAQSRGRPLAFAITHPEPDATLPKTPRGRTVIAAIIALASLLMSVAVPLRRRWAGALPVWLAIACASVVVIRGLPTLSNPIIYPPLGWATILAATPGFMYLIGALLLTGGRAPLAFVLLQIGLPSGLALAALVACGGIEALVDERAGPPLARLWTAQASVSLSLLAAGALLLAAGSLFLAVRPARIIPVRVDRAGNG
jgi:hypothetical protein